MLTTEEAVISTALAQSTKKEVRLSQAVSSCELETMNVISPAFFRPAKVREREGEGGRGREEFHQAMQHSSCTKEDSTPFNRLLEQQDRLVSRPRS